ncbi:MAG: exodeoxyribonuclease III [Candidatus Cloacimonetes bacterium]|nr:exodeoxyribonuclease III [Candidatus Cloacimonadota bacterium]
MIIWSWNVNGLRAVMKKDFLEIIRKYNPDIFCLQETKLQKDQIPEELDELTEYCSHWDFAEKKGYSGVATFSKLKPISTTTSINAPEFETEGRIIATEFDDFTLFNIYFPNGQQGDERLDYKLRFYDRVLEVMLEYKETGRNIVVCGDYNTAHKPIDLARPKQNENYSGFLPIERAWLDNIVAHGFVDTFRHFDPRPEQYSWWSYRLKARENNTGWRIDYFFVNEEFLPRVKNAYILQEVEGSDHCPVVLEIEDK